MLINAISEEKTALRKHLIDKYEAKIYATWGHDIDIGNSTLVFIDLNNSSLYIGIEKLEDIKHRRPCRKQVVYLYELFYNSPELLDDLDKLIKKTSKITNLDGLKHLSMIRATVKELSPNVY